MGKMQEALRKAEEARVKQGPDAGRAALGATGAGTGASFGAGLATTIALSQGPRLGDVDAHLVALTEPTSETAEQYRTLKANVLALREMPPKVVMVTSTNRGEGRSVTTVNLACSLAEEQGARVVVVDADMKRPTLHKLLGIDNQRGLADYLSGGTMIEMIIQRSRLPNLRAVPAGRVPANPAELLRGKGMEDLLARLRRDYDHVIIDAPPVGSSDEAAALAPRVDAALVVVRMRETSRHAAKASIERLREAGAKHIGSVLVAL